MEKLHILLAGVVAFILGFSGNTTITPTTQTFTASTSVVKIFQEGVHATTSEVSDVVSVVSTQEKATKTETKIKIEDSVYVIKNGKVYYDDQDHCDMECNSPIVGVDVKTFFAINPGYAKDKNFVYLLGEQIKNVDLNTFKMLTEEECSSPTKQYFDDFHPRLCYFVDKNVAFLNKEKIIGSNSDTFSVSEISNVYATDKNNAYFNGKKINNVDIKTFSVVSPWYAKDVNHVYSGSSVIDNADIQSFQAVATSSYYSYAVDKNRVYRNYVTMNDLSYSSYSKAADSSYLKILNINYMKDNRNVYYRIIPGRSELSNLPVALKFSGKINDSWVIVPGADVETFSVFKDDRTLAKDKNTIYSEGVHLLNVDPSSFQKVKNTSSLEEKTVNSGNFHANFGDDTPYIKDKNKVFYLAGSWLQELPGADPSSFEIIKTIRMLTGRDIIYAHDKARVYKNWELIPNEYPQTFKVPVN
jgi:hypothetical protein